MPIKITSPWNYPERILAYGKEGSGKSTLTCNILRYQTDVHAWVTDLDYSYSYNRQVETEYPDIKDRIHVLTVDQEWGAFQEAADKIAMDAKPERGDWWTIDPTTATWQMVQSWYMDEVHGEDIADHLLDLRKASQAARDAATNATQKEEAKKQYGRDQVEDMTWPLINKIYQRQFYSRLHKWRGNFILCCEAESLRKDAAPEEKADYGFIGQKPKGQKTLPFVAASNIYLAHEGADKWTMTSVKDRGRKLQDKTPFTDFALDYLVEVAGWKKEFVKGDG